MIKKLIAIAALVAIPMTAHATTLTFDLAGGVDNRDSTGDYGDRVSGVNADASGSGAGAAGTYGVGSEGATPNVVIDFDAPSPQVWTTGYSNLTNVFFAEPDGINFFGFTLRADDGFEVTLSSFDLGNFGGALVLPSISVIADDIAAPPLVNYALAGSGSPAQTITPNATGKVVQVLFDVTGLGGSTDNIGFDNILFSQTQVITPPAVPLPAGLPLMLAGLGAFAWMRRRQTV